MARPARSRWWVQAGLIGLAVIPAVSGTLRLIEVFGGPRTMPVNPRIGAAAGWVINLAVAELIIRRPARRRSPSSAPRLPHDLEIRGAAAEGIGVDAASYLRRPWGE